MNNILTALLAMLNDGKDVTIKANSNAHNDLKKIVGDVDKLTESVVIFIKNNWQNPDVTHFDQLQKSLRNVRQSDANPYDLSDVARLRRKHGEQL